jgi:hypothetical protein
MITLPRKLSTRVMIKHPYVSRCTVRGLVIFDHPHIAESARRLVLWGDVNNARRLSVSVLRHRLATQLQRR